MKKTTNPKVMIALTAKEAFALLVAAQHSAYSEPDVWLRNYDRQSRNIMRGSVLSALRQLSQIVNGQPVEAFSEDGYRVTRFPNCIMDEECLSKPDE